MASESTIKLNIGGTIFETTRSTLTKYEGYFKTRLESGIPLDLNESGCLYIDRSPEHFHLILNFLRDGFVPMPDSASDVAKLLQEARYYGLEGLVYLCGGEMSEEWKKANLDKVYLKDWERGNLRREILYAVNREELHDFQGYCDDKVSLLTNRFQTLRIYHLLESQYVVINYVARSWGEILENQHVIDMVQKYSRTWNIIFQYTGNKYGHYEIYRPNKPPVCSFGRSREEIGFFESICQDLDAMLTNN